MCPKKDNTMITKGAILVANSFVLCMFNDSNDIAMIATWKNSLVKSLYDSNMRRFTMMIVNSKDSTAKYF